MHAPQGRHVLQVSFHSRWDADDKLLPWQQLVGQSCAAWAYMLADNEIAPPFVSSPSSTGTEERLQPLPLYFVFMILLLHKSMHICYIGNENLQIRVIYPATFNQYLIHSPDLIVRMLIASQSSFIWNVVLTLLAGLLGVGFIPKLFSRLDTV